MSYLVGGNFRSWFGFCLVISEDPDGFPCFPAAVSHVGGFNELLPFLPSTFGYVLSEPLSSLKGFITERICLEMVYVFQVQGLRVFSEALDEVGSAAARDMTSRRFLYQPGKGIIVAGSSRQILDGGVKIFCKLFPLGLFEVEARPEGDRSGSNDSIYP